MQRNETRSPMVNLDLSFTATHGNLSRALADSLKRSLVQSRLDAGEKLPSNREIATLAGVSQVTARMAVERLCREGVLESRPGVGTFVRQLPGDLALPRQPGVSRIGVVLSPWDSRDEAAWDYRRMLGDVLGALGAVSRQLLIFTYAQWLEYARRRPIELVTENGLDTLVWFYNGPLETAFIVELEQQKFRQLIFNRRQPGVRVPAILHDESGMVDDIVNHLGDEALNNLLILTGDPILSPYCERQEALLRALERRNIRRQPENFIQLPEAPFPGWVKRLLPEEINLRRSAVVLDWVGCINLWPEIIPELKTGCVPELISLFPLETHDHSGEVSFHYTYYQPGHSYVISKLLRDFFAGRSAPEPLLLPFRRCEI